MISMHSVHGVWLGEECSILALDRLFLVLSCLFPCSLHRTALACKCTERQSLLSQYPYLLASFHCVSNLHLDARTTLSRLHCFNVSYKLLLWVEEVTDAVRRGEFDMTADTNHSIYTYYTHTCLYDLSLLQSPDCYSSNLELET